MASAGFTLVEVVLAVGIVAFGIIAIVTLLPTALVSVQDGKLEEAASDVVALAAADLRGTPRSGVVSPLFGLNPFDPSALPVTMHLDASGATVSAPDQAAFRLTMTPRPGANPELTIWHAAVEWPPQAAVPANRVESVIILGN